MPQNTYDKKSAGYLPNLKYLPQIRPECGMDVPYPVYETGSLPVMPLGSKIFKPSFASSDELSEREQKNSKEELFPDIYLEREEKLSRLSKLNILSEPFSTDSNNDNRRTSEKKISNEGKKESISTTDKILRFLFGLNLPNGEPFLKSSSSYRLALRPPLTPMPYTVLVLVLVTICYSLTGHTFLSWRYSVGGSRDLLSWLFLLTQAGTMGMLTSGAILLLPKIRLVRESMVYRGYKDWIHSSPLLMLVAYALLVGGMLDVIVAYEVGMVLRLEGMDSIQSKAPSKRVVQDHRQGGGRYMNKLDINKYIAENMMDSCSKGQ